MSKNKYRVQLPLWFTEGEVVFGFTDKVNTCCCSAEICWFVEVPEYNYSGYFKVKDLEEVNNEKSTEQKAIRRTY